MPKPKLEVRSTETDEVFPLEIFTEELIALGDGMEKLLNTRLTDKALYLLIQHAMPSTKRLNVKEIEGVMDACKSLRATYIKKAKIS